MPLRHDADDGGDDGGDDGYCDDDYDDDDDDGGDDDYCDDDHDDDDDGDDHDDTGDDDHDCDGYDDLTRTANPGKYNRDIIKSDREQKFMQCFNILSAIVYTN